MLLASLRGVSFFFGFVVQGILAVLEWQGAGTGVDEWHLLSTELLFGLLLKNKPVWSTIIIVPLKLLLCNPLFVSHLSVVESAFHGELRLAAAFTRWPPGNRRKIT